MELEDVYGFGKYVVRDGVLRIYCRVERTRRRTELWIDKIEIHGSIEALELIMRLRKLRKCIELHKVPGDKCHDQRG